MIFEKRGNFSLFIGGPHILFRLCCYPFHIQVPIDRLGSGKIFSSKRQQPLVSESDASGVNKTELRIQAPDVTRVIGWKRSFLVTILLEGKLLRIQKLRQVLRQNSFAHSG